MQFAPKKCVELCYSSHSSFVCHGKDPRTPMTAEIDSGAALKRQSSDMPEFVTKRQQIFTHCTSCHGGGAAAHGSPVWPTAAGHDLQGVQEDQAPGKQRCSSEGAGPFKGEKVISKNAYELEFPKLWRRHDVSLSSHEL